MLMIGVLVYPDFQLLDASGPISVFEIAAPGGLPTRGLKESRNAIARTGNGAAKA